jgi:hypothetical protein
MVAASIQNLASARHGAAAPPDRNTASSQGVLMEANDATQPHKVPKIGEECRQPTRHIPVADSTTAPADLG